MLTMGRVGLYINTRLRTVSDEFQCIGVVINSIGLHVVLLINEYEFVDPVYPLHIPTDNFPTVSLD